MATSPRLAHLLPEERAALRSTLAERIDRRLALFIGGSLAVHVAIATYAWLADVPVEPPGYVHTTAYHHDVIDVTLPDVPAVDAPRTDAPGVATPAAPRQTAKPIVRPTNLQRPASGDDAQRLASILTGANDSDRGTGSMSPRQPGADLRKQIDDARNRTIAIGDGTQTSRSDDRVRLGTDPRTPLVDDPTLTHSAPRRDEDTLKGRIAIGPVKPDDATTLTPSAVLDRIKSLYMAGLQRCYKDGLKLDSTLSGRVAISFTVDDRGKVIDASAAGVTREVDGCIERSMSGWRFPIPKDDDGAGTDASFAVSLALQPS